MNKPNWTPEKPIEPGWYWHKESKDLDPIMVEAELLKNGNILFEPMGDIVDPEVFSESGFWYGPIQPPEFEK